jgi:peptidoglycan/LPS O-acetylase OafA/YrhL
MKTNHLPALTGIRFVAASLVFFCHYPSLLTSKAESPFVFYLLRQMNIGVNIFFVLSGFLITYRYLETQPSMKNLRLYFAKRFARIYPLYFLLLLFHYGMLYRQRGEVAPVFEVFLNLSLIKGLSGQYYLTGIAQAWSLTVEEMFYVSAPFLFLLLRAKTSLIQLVGGLLIVALVLCGIFHFFPFHGFFAGLPFVFSTTFFGRCFEFACGVYLALRVLNKPSLMSGSTRFTTFGGLLFLVLLLIQTSYAVSFEVEAVNKTVFGILLSNFVFPVAIALTFYGLIVEETILKKLLSSKPFIVLGKSSYAFYLVHLGFAAEMVYFHVSSHWLLLFLCLQAFSVFLYKAVEQPICLFLLKSFSTSKQHTLQAGVIAAQ